MQTRGSGKTAHAYHMAWRRYVLFMCVGGSSANVGWFMKRVREKAMATHDRALSIAYWNCGILAAQLVLVSWLQMKLGNAASEPKRRFGVPDHIAMHWNNWMCT